MSERPGRRLGGLRRGLPPWLALCLIALGMGFLSLALGQSVNWDLLNYHLYNPHAWLNGRWEQDIAPAQLQSFFNPSLHLPYYLGWMHLDPRLLAFLTGMVQGTCAWPLYRLSRLLLPHHSSTWALTLALLGLLGPLMLSELGTVFGDSLLALPLLGSLCLLLESRERAAWHLAAGFLAGLALGLKLTVAIVVPGLVLAAMALVSGRRLLRCWLLLALGLVLGFALTGGWWHWGLWETFRNPVFPALNGIFDSSWAPVDSSRDLRYLPSNLIEGVFLPLLGPLGLAEVLELKFRAPRMLLLFLLLLSWPLLRNRIPAGLRQRFDACLALAAGTWLSWSFLFGHYRYLAFLECLAPVLLAATALQLLPPRRAYARGLLLALLLTQLAIKIPGWGRMPFGELEAGYRPPEDSLVVMAGLAPMAWMVPSWPASVPVIRVDGNLWQPGDGTRMWQEAKRRLEAHRGPMVALFMDRDRARATAQLKRAGLHLRPSECIYLRDRRLPSLAGRILRCPVVSFHPGLAQPDGP